MVKLKYADVRVGDHLIADGGFTCLACGSVNTVYEPTPGEYAIRCKAGIHYLDGQKDYSGELVGFSKA